MINRGARLSFDGLDVVILLGNTFGEAETTFQGLKNFVQGCGLLITEWNGAAQALNAASLLDAEDRGNFSVGTLNSNPLSSITFTHRANRLSQGVPKPYVDIYDGRGVGIKRTGSFRRLENLGVGVVVFASVTGQDLPCSCPSDSWQHRPVIIGGQSGNGYVLVIGTPWYSLFHVANGSTRRLIQNAVNFSSADFLVEALALSRS